MSTSASLRGVLRRSPLPLLGTGAVAAAAGLALVIAHPRWWPISVATILAVPGLAAALRVRSTVRTVDPGDPGIRPVFERLEAGGYRVWHDIRVGRQRLDHMIVGPSGAFVIRSVSTPGRLALGHKDGVLRLAGRDAGELVWQVTRQTMAVRGVLADAGLRVPVRGVVAMTRARFPEGPVDMGKTIFLPVGLVPGYVAHHAAVLDDAQIEQAARAVPATDGSFERHPSRA